MFYLTASTKGPIDYYPKRCNQLNTEKYLHCLRINILRRTVGTTVLSDYSVPERISFFRKMKLDLSHLSDVRL